MATLVCSAGARNTLGPICCNLDVWGILVNIILQDAPFFAFRVMLIIYYELISSMNLFCTAKNTLVITLQVEYQSNKLNQMEAAEAAAKDAEKAKLKKNISQSGRRGRKGGSKAERRKQLFIILSTRM